MRRIIGLCALLITLIFAWPAPSSAEDEAGVFDYYTLALSWSPTYCAKQGRSRPNEPQCAGERPYSFVLHGLWPQHKRGWPQFCETRERPWVSDQIIQKMLDIMPSKRLIINEYRKHGTCTGLSPSDYFRISRRAFEAIKIPPRFQNPQDYQTVSPEEIEREFLNANPNLKPEMISVDCKDRRLRELRICFTRDVQLTDCGPNERQGKLCSSEKIVIPPVRAGTPGNRNRGNDGDFDGGQEGSDDENGDDEDDGDNEDDEDDLDDDDAGEGGNEV